VEILGMAKASFIRYVLVYGLLKVGFIGCVLIGGFLLLAAHRFSLQRTLEFLDGQELSWFLSALAIGVLIATLNYIDDWLSKRRKSNDG
jgi:cell division protein FtsX